jgi:hypothetical protein
MRTLAAVISKSFVMNRFLSTDQHDYLMRKIATVRRRSRMMRRSFLKHPTKHSEGSHERFMGHWGFLGVGGFFVVGLEMSFQITQ